MAEIEQARIARAAGVLAAAPLFAGSSQQLLDALAHASQYVSCKAQQVVFLAGEQSDGLYIVARGWLKAVRSAVNGREQTMALFGPGEVFNDIAALADTVTQASVIALEDSDLCHIPRAALLALVDDYPELAQLIIRSLARRVIYLGELVEDLALRPVEARLARLILLQASDDQIERQPWATQAELAARLGTVPDVLNRALRTLVEAGLVAVERRSIRVLDRVGLEARAQVG